MSTGIQAGFSALLFLCFSNFAHFVIAQEPGEASSQNQEAVQASSETPTPDQPDPSKTEQAEKIMVLTLSDEEKYMVDKVQADFIIESLDRAEQEGFTRVILKLDTYGGVVFAARDINKRLLNLKIPSVAYVETKAISAGVFIAWACDEIVMQKLTTIGDAQMVTPTPEGGIEEAPEKLVTVYRSDWEAASEAKGRSFALARAFFEKKVVLLQIGEPDNWTFILKRDYDRLSDQEKQQKPILDILDTEEELLTLHAEKAERLGIVALAEGFDAFLASRGWIASEFEAIEMTFNQKILRYLGSNPWIYLLLVLIGLHGLYVELKAPGFGIPGFTAIVCFTALFGTRYLLGTADMTEVGLFVIGVLLCVIEIFVTPGVGILGASGIVLMLGSMVMASLPDLGEIPDVDLQWTWLSNTIMLTLLAMALSFLSMFLIVPILFKLPMTQRRLLPNEFKAEDGYVMKTVEDDARLKGVVGVAQSPLHPVGKMLTDDGRYMEVVSEAGFVERGAKIKIHQVDGNRIVVRPIH